MSNSNVLGFPVRSIQMDETGAYVLAPGAGRAAGKIVIGNLNTTGIARIPLSLSQADMVLSGLAGDAASASRSVHFHTTVGAGADLGYTVLHADLNLAPGLGNTSTVYYFFP